VSFIKPDAPLDVLMANICGYSDRVCHGRENAPHDFFFIYGAFFHDLHVTLPFDDVTNGGSSNPQCGADPIAPNSWACLQAFRIICDIFKIIPTPQSFLFYYNFRPSTSVSWLSLLSRPGSVWFAAFTTSYKFFKEKILKNIC